MAGEIQLDAAKTGLTLYGLVFNSTGQIWNGSTFVTVNAANWATYAIMMTEQSTSGYYIGTFPIIAAGVYTTSVRRQVGGSPATTDPIYGAGLESWDGTAVILQTSRLEFTAARAGYLDELAAANIPADVDGIKADYARRTGDYLSDKAGFSLSATGLDAIAVTDPGAPANHTTLAKMIVAIWRTLWKKETMTATQYKRFADNGSTINAAAIISDDGTTQTKGNFS